MGSNLRPSGKAIGELYLVETPHRLEGPHLSRDEDFLSAEFDRAWRRLPFRLCLAIWAGLAVLGWGAVIALVRLLWGS